MQSFLRWSIENSSSQGESQSNSAPAVRSDLDPGIIDTTLGRPDAELMKEDLAVALDSEDNRVDALDHLEMVRYSISCELSCGPC
jgi:hsp70-interacting protein